MYARIDRERLWPYMGGIAQKNGTIPKCLGSVSDHLPLCISQLQETIHPIEQQLEQHRTLGLAAPDHTVPYGTRFQTFRNNIQLKPVANCPGGTVRS